MSQVSAVSPEDIKKLQHMLGVVPGRNPKSTWKWRSYYATSGGESMEAMERLVAAGFAVKGAAHDTMSYYHPTIEGCKKVSLTKAQIKCAVEKDTQ